MGKRSFWRISLITGIFVFLAAISWLGYSGFQARTDLEAAKNEIQNVSSFQTIDAVSLANSLDEASQRVDAASARISDPLWTFVSYIPLLGNTPHALREATFTVDELLAGTDQLQQKLRQTNSAKQFIDPELLTLLSETAVDFKPRVEAAAKRLAAINYTLVPSQLSEPIQNVQRQMVKVLPIVDEASKFAEIAPDLLGLNGQRRWLVVFGNTAEARPSSGFPGGMGIITADMGKLSLSKLESNNRLSNVAVSNVDSLVSEEAVQLYGSDMSRLLDMGLSPDFELAGSLMWNLYTQNTDVKPPVGVITMDEHALQALMYVTGPVTVEGKQITAGQIVEYVTRTVYVDHKDVKDKDAALLSISQQVFDKLKTGDVGALGLAKALLPAIEAGRVRAWAVDEEIQSIIRRTSLSGDVKDPKKVTHIVAIANGGGNKIEAYVQADVQYWGGVCDLNLPFRTSTLRIALSNSAPESGLPAYVTPRLDKGDFAPKPQGSNREIVYVHLPPGSELQSAMVGEYNVEPLVQGSENGRWVWRFDIELKAQSSKTLVIQFSEPAMERKPMAKLWVQPMTLPMTTNIKLGPVCSA